MTDSPNRINWSDPRLGSGVYEDMVAVLLSRLHPGTQRIDGSGGDGGRDVQLPLPSGLEIFELKSFTGRLSNAKRRRAQVKQSLDRAAAHTPSAWHLVVPIDHTDGELRWFEELTAECSFPCDWRGVTWLDSQMAAHPDIGRYYLKGSESEALELLRELHQEQAGLERGVPDAIDRVRALAGRLNAIDPHYTFGVSVQVDGTIAVTMIPRYKGAESDRLVSVNGTFQFPNTVAGIQAAEEFQNTIYYGTPSVISSDYVKTLDVDAPAGMGGSFSGATLQLGAALDSSVEGLSMTIRIVNQDGHVTAQLPVFGQTRTVGQRGGELTFADASGALRVTARLDVTTRAFNLNYQYSPLPGLLPGSVWPVVHLLSAMRRGSQLVALLEGKEVGPPVEIADEVDEWLTGWKQVVQLLDDVQRFSGVYFPVPESLTRDDLQSIKEAHRLLSGETLTGSWSQMSVTTSVEGYRSLTSDISGDEGKALFTESEYLLVLDGQEFPLGRVRKTCASAQLKVAPQVSGDAPLDASVELTFVPGADKSVSLSMVRAPLESERGK